MISSLERVEVKQDFSLPLPTNTTSLHILNTYLYNIITINTTYNELASLTWNVGVVVMNFRELGGREVRIFQNLSSWIIGLSRTISYFFMVSPTSLLLITKCT